MTLEQNKRLQEIVKELENNPTPERLAELNAEIDELRTLLL